MTAPSPANRRLRAVLVEAGAEPRSYLNQGQRVTMVPLTIRRRQNRKLLMPPTGTPDPSAVGGLDESMVKTLGKAFYWQRLLDQGRHATAADLALALKLEPGWVSEVLRLTLLAPDIVEAVLAGRQPRHLNLHALRGRQNLLPRDWAEQRQMLGFTD